jgi:peptidoglycan lytic transglycosylase G
MFKKILFGLIVIALIAGVMGYQKYKDVFNPNVPEVLENQFLQVPSNSDFEDLVKLLTDQKVIINEASFRWVADQMSFTDSKVRSGRFEIQPNWSNRALINHLRSGKQATVKVILTNERLPEDVAGKVSKIIEADSTSIDNLLRNASFLQEYGYTPETAMSVFIPNTYDFFWNQNAKAFFEKMLKENEKFWNKNNRKEKAKKLGLSPQEVYTLASIVGRETNQIDEKPTIAGLYLNRIKVGMPLQADPTVVFAVRQFDLKRVLFKHLEYDSPYNTYMYRGLPPGPISMAEISSIDAVLDFEDHEYFYFCAKGDGTGYHSFAKTLSGHNANAVEYRKNLVARGKR